MAKSIPKLYPQEANQQRTLNVSADLGNIQARFVYGYDPTSRVFSTVSDSSHIKKLTETVWNIQSAQASGTEKNRYVRIGNEHYVLGKQAMADVTERYKGEDRLANGDYIKGLVCFIAEIIESKGIQTSQQAPCIVNLKFMLPPLLRAKGPVVKTCLTSGTFTQEDDSVGCFTVTLGNQKTIHMRFVEPTGILEPAASLYYTMCKLNSDGELTFENADFSKAATIISDFGSYTMSYYLQSSGATKAESLSNGLWVRETDIKSAIQSAYPSFKNASSPMTIDSVYRTMRFPTGSPELRAVDLSPLVYSVFEADIRSFVALLAPSMASYATERIVFTGGGSSTLRKCGLIADESPFLSELQSRMVYPSDGTKPFVFIADNDFISIGSKSLLSHKQGASPSYNAKTHTSPVGIEFANAIGAYAVLVAKEQ